MTPRPTVLCYHAVSDDWHTPLAVSTAQIRSQLTRYAEAGYTGITLLEAERRRSAGTLPKKSVVVTFDDAFSSILRAQPVLEELGWPATVYVVGDFVAGDRPLEWDGITEWLTSAHRDELRCLSEAELRALQTAGWEIGAHTMSHPLLPSLEPEKCLHELAASRDLLTQLFGACDTVAYPYGHANARVAELAARAGFTAGCTLNRSLRLDEPLRRPRIAVSGPDSPLRAWLKTSEPAIWLRRTLPSVVTERL
jgi:peptidoglycan/xylan/chitin deacetylase (PgdA/CDA1 family)